MITVLTKEEMKLSDRYTIDNLISEEKLVKKAGKALFDSYDYKGKTTILIGKGNNGADGVYLASLLDKDSKEVEIVYFEESKSEILKKLLNEAKDIKKLKYNNDYIFDADTIVDAIYGTGFKGKLEGDIQEAIIKANNSKGYKIAVDMNSGLDGNSGLTTLAFKSDLTISIGYYKPGHFLGMAKDYIKKVINKEIGIMPIANNIGLFEERDLETVFIKRNNYSHKGTYGYVGIMGGSINYSGAIKLSSMSLASLISGSGVARVIVPSDIKESVAPYLLEQTLCTIPSNNGFFTYDEKAIDKCLDRLSSLAFGMGIGISDDNEKILSYILNKYEGKLVIDADGINTLSKMNLNILNESKASIVLTPHLKEFSRLVNKSVEEIENNPLETLKEFVNKYHVTVLLKGTSTIIINKEKALITSSGAVSLSKGGSGDILSGILVGILGFQNDLLLSAASASYLLGRAGEESLKNNGSYASLPRDTIVELKKILKRY